MITTDQQTDVKTTGAPELALRLLTVLMAAYEISRTGGSRPRPRTPLSERRRLMSREERRRLAGGAVL